MERYMRIVFLLSGCFLLGFYLPNILGLAGEIVASDIHALREESNRV